MDSNAVLIQCDGYSQFELNRPFAKEPTTGEYIILHCDDLLPLTRQHPDQFGGAEFYGAKIHTVVHFGDSVMIGITEPVKLPYDSQPEDLIPELQEIYEQKNAPAT
jgi:hypothetical protein